MWLFTLLSIGFSIGYTFGLFEHKKRNTDTLETVGKLNFLVEGVSNMTATVANVTQGDNLIPLSNKRCKVITKNEGSFHEIILPCITIPNVWNMSIFVQKSEHEAGFELPLATYTTTGMNHYVGAPPSPESIDIDGCLVTFTCSKTGRATSRYFKGAIDYIGFFEEVSRRDASSSPQAPSLSSMEEPSFVTASTSVDADAADQE